MSISIKDKITPVCTRAMAKCRRYSPTILAVTGAVSVVAGTVMACNATTKLSKIIDSATEETDICKKSVGDDTLKEEYTEEDCQKDISLIRLQTAVKIFKLYAPAAAVMILGLTMIFGAQHILVEREATMSAALGSISTAFSAYRERVAEKVGKEVENDIYLNKQVVDKEVTVADENGEEQTLSVPVPVYKPGYSPYAVIFDAANTNWNKSGYYNYDFLTKQETYFNDLLRVHKFVFLNEVYTSLGFPRTKLGQMVGWVYEPDDGKPAHNYISFNLEHYSAQQACRDYMDNHYERDYVLDFNVDGNILDRI